MRTPKRWLVGLPMAAAVLATCLSVLALRFPASAEPPETAAAERVLVVPRPAVGTASSTTPEIRLPILMYHHIRPMEPGFTAAQKLMTVTPESFRRQMLDLVSAGYTAIFPDELRAALAEGAPLPDKPVLITFDDGYAEQYMTVFPLMRELGLKAAYFAVSGYVERSLPGYMDGRMLAEMDSSGLAAIGSHAVNHRSLTGLDPEELGRETGKSRADLEALLGHPVTALAYPYGDYDRKVMAAAESAGYGLAFTAFAGNGHSSGTLFALRRIRVEDGQALGPLLDRWSE